MRFWSDRKCVEVRRFASIATPSRGNAQELKDCILLAKEPVMRAELSARPWMDFVRPGSSYSNSSRFRRDVRHGTNSITASRKTPHPWPWIDENVKYNPIHTLRCSRRTILETTNQRRGRVLEHSYTLIYTNENGRPQTVSNFSLKGRTINQPRNPQNSEQGCHSSTSLFSD